MRGLTIRLTRLLSGREEEFLDLGRRLMEFSSASQALAQKAQDLAQLAAGEDIGQGAQELAVELEEMSGVCDFSRGEQSLDELERVLKVIESLGAGISGFGRIVRSLQMLGISTRIESARLGDKGLGFTTLADDVEKLAGKIVANSSQVMDKGRSLSGMISDAHGQTKLLVGAQKGCSSRIVTELKTNLDGLVGLTGSSRSLSASLADRSGDIAAGISEVVASLQFHDIVRQQVEHVEEALHDMMGMVRQRGERQDCGREGGSAPAAEPNQELTPELRDLVGWIADVAKLQESQLGNAGERFASALQSLRRNLEDIARSIASMRQDAERLAADESGGEGSVLDRIEQGSLSIIESMRQFAEQAEHIGGVMATVAGTVAEMVGFVEDIEEVGSEIELIALNAAVKAARTGDEGRALGVLAQAIQKLSVEARDKTGDVSRALTEISRSSQDLETNAAGYLDTSRLAGLAARQEGLMHRLRDVNTRFMSGLGEVREQSGRLSERLRDTAAHAVLDREICAELDAARADMGSIAETARRAVPLADDSTRSQRLKELLSRYTMEVERLVHEAAFGQGGGELRDKAEGEVELFEDDNVELF
jgi:methyl-accepting chemotaxis protein